MPKETRVVASSFTPPFSLSPSPATPRDAIACPERAHASTTLLRVAARTGRNDERSPQLAAEAAPLDPLGLVAAVFDHLPCARLRRRLPRARLRRRLPCARLRRYCIVGERLRLGN